MRYPTTTVPPDMHAGVALQAKMANPTLRENIDAKIHYHEEEILRLRSVKNKLPQLLDVNLRDLQEAMHF